jgi:hypothetical protein
MYGTITCISFILYVLTASSITLVVMPLDDNLEGDHFLWLMQGMSPFFLSSMRFSSRAKNATNHDVCSINMEAMAMAQLMQNDCKPGKICKLSMLLP